MYIEKRWLVPAGLSLLLLGAFFAGVLLLVGSRFPQAAGTLRPAQITNVEAQSRAPRTPEAAPVPDPMPAIVAAPQAAPVPDVIAAAQPVRGAEVVPAAQAPEEVVGIATTGSGATQINTRGFGDIGLQLQDVNINGPVTFVHISNQGNNNSTNVNTAPNDRIRSNQSRLQSNRSDATPAPTAVATGGAARGVVNARPASATGGQSRSAATRRQ